MSQENFDQQIRTLFENDQVTPASHVEAGVFTALKRRKGFKGLLGLLFLGGIVGWAVLQGVDSNNVVNEVPFTEEETFVPVNDATPVSANSEGDATLPMPTVNTVQVSGELQEEQFGVQVAIGVSSEDETDRIEKTVRAEQLWESMQPLTVEQIETQEEKGLQVPVVENEAWIIPAVVKLKE